MLHIINKSPMDRPSLASVLRVARSDGAVLLIEDGVYAAARGNAFEATLRALMERMPVHVLAADAEARGIADRLIPGVVGVDYGGFVELVVAHPNCQSWL